MVTGVDEDLAEQIERLLGAGRDHDVVRVGVHGLLGHEHGRALAQGELSLTASVLQRRRTEIADDLGRNLEHILGRKCFDVGHPAGEGNDIRA